MEEKWLPHAATRVRPTTHERYVSLMRRHVLPRIGRVQLSKLRPMHVQAVVDGMVADGLAPRTTIQAYRVLSSALRQGVRWQMLVTNPAAAVVPPRAERPMLVTPEASDVRRLLDARDGQLRIALVLAATSGMRRGEVAAAKWSALDGSSIRVTESLQRAGGELRTMHPKTDNSRRSIVLPAVTLSALRQWRKEQNERRLYCGVDWNDEGYIIDRGDGRPCDPAWLSHAFQRLCKQVGVEGVRWHDLRHGFATELLRADVHPKVVSEALGHSSTAFTMDTYSHVLPSMGDRVADAMEVAFGTGSKTGSKP